MHPIICKLGPFTIYSYGAMLALAFMTSSMLAAKKAKDEQFNPNIIFNFSFVAFISGIIGARLFYIIENLAYYRKHLLETLMLQYGGLSWFGGLIFAIICGVVYLKKKKLSVYKTFDLMAPFVALAQAIGRIGCLLNGCCFGWIGHIPAQIFSSLSLIIIFIILRFLQDRPHKEGQIFFTYLVFYSLKRFFIEFWRLDNEVIFLGLTLFQIISVVMFCIAFLKIIKLRSH